MMVIPAIDIMDSKVVRLRRGDPAEKTVYGDNPLEFARRWTAEGADMLHIVDLDATLGIGSNSSLIAKVANESGIPVEVAGGLRSVDAAAAAAGERNRVVIGTMAFADRASLAELRDSLGASRVVVSLDHRGGSIVIRGWTEGTGTGLAEAMDSLISDGITEFMITDVGRDGMMAGPELDLLAEACSRRANVIASGGIAGVDDVRKVCRAGAAGVILGRAIYDQSLGLQEAKDAACP